MATPVIWGYDLGRNADVTTLDADGTEWRAWVWENYGNHRFDVTCDWGDTYQGAPTRSGARDIAERFIRQRFGVEEG